MNKTALQAELENLNFNVNVLIGHLEDYLVLITDLMQNHCDDEE